jgi:hypothetical protein
LPLPGRVINREKPKRLPSEKEEQQGRIASPSSNQLRGPAPYSLSFSIPNVAFNFDAFRTETARWVENPTGELPQETQGGFVAKIEHPLRYR